MIKRLQKLSQKHSFFLFGARGIGKTTLYLFAFLCAIWMSHAQADQNSVDKEKFLSLNTGLEFVLNESFGSWNVSFEYGQSIVSPQEYFGFFTVGATWNIDGPGLYSINVEYGYEFRRDKTFSFGLNTFHSVGKTTGLKSYGFGNAFGVFGRIKWTDAVSTPIQIGLSHNNPFKTVIAELTDNANFGPYIHIGIRYDLL